MTEEIFGRRDFVKFLRLYPLSSSSDWVRDSNICARCRGRIAQAGNVLRRSNRHWIPTRDWTIHGVPFPSFYADSGASLFKKYPRFSWIGDKWCCAWVWRSRCNALLEIFNTNQGLLNNIINISGMTPATQGPFVKKLQQVIDARKKLFFHTSEGPNALNS